jgi:general stress protein 26
MITELPIKFLQEKILELQSALFFPDNDSVLKIPTHVINCAEADQDGQIWFMIPRPTQQIHEFEREFPAKLDFFKKGKGFYLKIQGKASIVSNPDCKKESIPVEMKQKLKEKQLVAIKVKVQNADYFENVPKPSSSNWIQTGTSQFMNWLLNPKYDQQSPQLITIPITIE